MTNEAAKSDVLAKSVREFIEATAAKTPTPGGGSVAGVVGGLAVALGEMALNFTRGKKKYAEHEEYYAHLGRRMEKARQMFDSLVADDIQAYGLYREASAMEAGDEKDKAMQLALAASTDVPRQTTKLALAVLGDLAAFVDKCNPYLISDLTAAATLAAAVTRLSDYNVAINTPWLDDKDAANDIRQASLTDLDKADAMRQQIEQAAAG